MDGFGSNSGVIILAATNRADILDKALGLDSTLSKGAKPELENLL